VRLIRLLPRLLGSADSVIFRTSRRLRSSFQAAGQAELNNTTKCSGKTLDRLAEDAFGRPRGNEQSLAPEAPDGSRVTAYQRMQWRRACSIEWAEGCLDALQRTVTAEGCIVLQIAEYVLHKYRSTTANRPPKRVRRASSWLLVQQRNAHYGPTPLVQSGWIADQNWRQAATSQDASDVPRRYAAACVPIAPACGEHDGAPYLGRRTRRASARRREPRRRGIRDRARPCGSACRRWMLCIHRSHQAAATTRRG
jgi:hypothetical protein